MTEPQTKSVKFDLLKVGHCQHPECIALRGGGRRAVDFPALVGLIEHPRLGLVLYDTGYSSHFDRETRRFPECLYRMVTPVTLPKEEQLLVQLESRGIRPVDIQTIIISHFHADHVAGLKDFPKARFIATQDEHEKYRTMSHVGQVRRAYLSGLLPDDLEDRLVSVNSMLRIALPSHYHPFDQGYDLGGDASLLGVNLPGHVASQLGLAFEAQDMGPVFLVADSCWKIQGLQDNRKPSRLAYVLFDDRQAYNQTFDCLCTLYKSTHSPRIIPSHCMTTWKQVGGSRRISLTT